MIKICILTQLYILALTTFTQCAQYETKQHLLAPFVHGAPCRHCLPTNIILTEASEKGYTEMNGKHHAYMLAASYDMVGQ